MTEQGGAGLDVSMQETVRILLEDLLQQPADTRRNRLRELTTDTETILLVEHLLEQHAQTPAGVAQVKALDTELQEGDMLGPWRLLERIASGGMGTVFIADRADGLYRQRAAVKLLRGRADPATTRRMAAERQLLAKLQHPGIARLYDGGNTPAGHPYLVMEYVDGRTLHRYCRDLKPGLAARILLFQQVCDAVQAAHRHLIVHCDIKPGNVLVREDGSPVLLDFGIARALDGSGDAGGFCTPGYASPELQAGGVISTASDIYSLGVLLAELLSGTKVPRAAPESPLPAPSTLAQGDAWAWRSRLRGDLDAIVAKATAANPEQRYAAVAELRDDLQRWREYRPVSARSAGMGYRAQRWLRRNWRPVAVASALLVLCGMFVWRLDAQHKLAVREALTAQQVSDLLADAFQFANPKNGGGSTAVSARDVLDAGAVRLDDGTLSDPAVKARLREVIGMAYFHLGQPLRAEPLMKSAAAGYLSPDVQQPLRAASTLAELAVLYSNGGESKKGIATAQRALQLYREHGGQPLDVANGLNSLGIALTDSDNDSAERALQEALTLRLHVVGENNVHVASTLHNLGRLEYKRENYVAAERYYRRSLAIKDKIGYRGARNLYNLEGLAKVLREQGRLEETLSLQQRILEETRRLQGDDGADLGNAHNELASTLHDLGRWVDAGRHYAEAERLSMAATGDDSIDYAISLNNRASLDEDRGALEAAERGFQRSLAIRSAKLEADDPSVLRATLNLGRLLLREGRLDAAGPLIERGWSLWKQSRGESGPGSVGHRLLHAEWLIAVGRREQAGVELAAMAQEVTRSKHVAWRYGLLAELAAASGNPGEAASQRKLAVASRAADIGADHVETARLRVAWAESLLAAGDAQSAARELQRAMRVLLPQLAAGAPLRARMQRLGKRLPSGAVRA